MDTPQRDTPESTELPEGTAVENESRERTSMDAELETPEDPLLRREEQAAASEAGGIGGPAPEYEGDEQARPLEESGQGVAEGFEESERELVERASHGERGNDPTADAFRPEQRSDESTGVYGEPDEVDPTEVTSDPREGADDPGQGPGLAADR